MVVGDAGQAVFAPAVRARARLVVGEIVPGVAVVGVVFADSPPLPLAQVRSPFFPGDVPGARVFEATLFGGHDGGTREHERGQQRAPVATATAESHLRNIVADATMRRATARSPWKLCDGI